MTVDVPAALGQDLDGERLPRVVRRTPAFVDRRRLGEPALEIDVGALEHVVAHPVAELPAALEHVHDPAREVGRHRAAVARPEREAAVTALEARQLVQAALYGGLSLLRVDSGEIEGLAE